MEQKTMFPRTTVGGISVSRMIIGSNWLAGWSHTGPAADKMITDRHCSPVTIDPILYTFMSHGVDTIMTPINLVPTLYDSIQRTQERCGKKMILIDTPIINVEDTAAARREAEALIQKGKQLGADFCLLHHSSVEQLVNKQKGAIERIGDYTTMIREAGLVPGFSAHMPEIILYTDQNGYDAETYIQIYNCMGFLMQVEIEAVNSIICNAQKPVMTIKPMAAGRVSPFVGLSFSWSTLRDCDMVTVGCFTEHEALEDIEYSLAAIERRAPEIGKRHSPNQSQAVLK